MFSILEIVGMFLTAWMVITGHYPLHIDKLIPTDHRKRNRGTLSFTLLVRISGLFFLAGIMLNAFGYVSQIFGSQTTGNAVIYGIAGLTLLVSLPKALH
jgi:hypothetical protein